MATGPQQDFNDADTVLAQITERPGGNVNPLRDRVDVYKVTTDPDLRECTVFLRHKSMKAEVAYAELGSGDAMSMAMAEAKRAGLSNPRLATTTPSVVPVDAKGNPARTMQELVAYEVAFELRESFM